MEVTMILSEIRQEARTMMQGLWGTCVSIWLVYGIVMSIPGIISYVSKVAFLNYVLGWLIGGPLLLGYTMIFLRIYRHEPFEIMQVFEGFKDFNRAFTAYILMTIYVAVGMILLIVPGIMLAMAYSMTFFIMAENPNMQATEAMRLSKQMMMGHKWELFWLGLSFLGWFVLSIFTFGIGLLWLGSYVTSANVIFYQKIKGKQEEIVITD
jgi:uncharacterized membrane protein